MSDTDDTDVLLLIPPDLFIVPSSDSDEELELTAKKAGVVSEIIEHVQSLEFRISAIESRDNNFELRQTSRCVSQPSIPVKSPSKIHRCSSLPSTPCAYAKKRTNAMRGGRSNTRTLTLKANSSRSWDKHDDLTSLSDSSVLKSTSRCSARTLHANLKRDQTNNILHDICNNSSTRARRSLFSSNSSRKSTENPASQTKKLDNLNLMEVEEMLREFEDNDPDHSFDASKVASSDPQDLTRKLQTESFLKFNKDKTDSMDNLDNLLLCNNHSTHYLELDKLWKTSVENDDLSGFKNTEDKVDGSKNQQSEDCSSAYRNAIKNTLESDLGTSHVSHNEGKPLTTLKYPEVTSDLFGSLNNTLLKANGSERTDSMYAFSEAYRKTNIEDESKVDYFKKQNKAKGDSCISKSQHIIALSDFWEQNSSKSQEELLRIKLEEEKLRREHCEYLIQELNKNLLEQQQKVAVAIKIDNKKNSVIINYQNSLEKLKQKYDNLETEYNNAQSILKNITEKHQFAISELETKVNKSQSELSKALNLADGYKEKSDTLVKEKIDLVKSHADELHNYKTLIEEIREDNNKLLEKNEDLEEMLQTVQKDLSKERTNCNDIRNEMAAIHKALDTCGEELTLLRQEKEHLNLKLNEETNKCRNLEESKRALLSAIEESKKAEKQAKDEVDTVIVQQEKDRCELRDVYQQQLDEVVKQKQQEFQTQLDAAELAYTRQQAIAECAVRKIKMIIKKHQLEINLLEEKHKEEKRLYDLQLAQVKKKMTLLETQLKFQQVNKNQIAEQLHSVMQKQWQQSLRIISGGNADNLASTQKVNIDKLFELKHTENNDVLMDHYIKEYNDPVRLEPANSVESRDMKSRENHIENLLKLASTDDIPTSSKRDSEDDLEAYLQKILDLRQSSENMFKARIKENNITPLPIYREVPKKHYIKKELSIMSEDNIIWQPISEVSVGNNSEYMSIPQKLGKEPQKVKPPWK